MSAQEKSNLKTVNLTVYTLLLSLVLCVVIGHTFYQAKILKAVSEDLGNTTKLIEDNNQKLSEEVEKLNEKMSSLKTNYTELKQDIKKQNKEISRIKSSIDKKNRTLVDFISKIENSIFLLSQSNKQEKVDNSKNKFSYYQSAEWQRKRAQYVSKNQKELPPIFPEKIINALGGTDTFNFNVKGAFPLDSFYLISIEKFNFLNGRENIVQVSAPGLVNLENNTIEIDGDPALDKVLLDGCLEWKKLEDKNSHKIYQATDINEKSRKVVVNGALEIEIEPKCDQDYISKNAVAIIQNSWKTGPISDLLEEAKKPVNYNPNKKENLNYYKKWLAGIENASVRRDMGFLLTLMEKDRIPTEFPRTPKGSSQKPSIMTMLYFNPKYSTVQDTSKKVECRSGRKHLNFVTNKENKKAIKCAWNDQAYVLGDEDQNLDDSWGNDIVFPGKGNDILKLGWGQDIIVIEDGWGKKTVSKTCHFSLVNYDELYNDIQVRPIFMGLGISYKADKDFLFIDKVTIGGAGEKSGLKRGDRIVKISGKKVSLLNRYQIAKMFRGGGKNVIRLDYMVVSQSLTEFE